MPYIKNKLMRNILNQLVSKHKWCLKPNGQLNYFLFKLAKDTCTNYAEYKSFLGELNEVTAEIRRRQLAPYENAKIIENGDVE